MATKFSIAKLKDADLKPQRDKGGRFIAGHTPLSPFPKGYKSPFSWNGKEFTESHRDNMRKGQLGKKRSEEHKRNIALAGIGRKFSKESRNKISEAHRGEKAYNWKGGITTLNIQIRTCFEYRQWRSDVYTRDRFTCVECNQKCKKLNADHIKPFSVIVYENKIDSLQKALECEELWNINNGRTLCVDCHKMTETFGGRMFKGMKKNEI